MVRLGHERFSVHRSAQILRAVRGNHLQTYQDRHRATPRRWTPFKQAIANLHNDNPKIANFTPCFYTQDHTTRVSLHVKSAIRFLASSCNC